MSAHLERGLRDAARHVSAAVPHGRTLADERWRNRHRVLIWVLWAQAVALVVVGRLYGFSFGHAALDTAPAFLFALVAELGLGGRRAQSLVVALGLLSCSAAVVHFSGGAAEAQFHFFLMVAALSLYEDWTPFALAIVFVLVQQGITAGTVEHSHAPWKSAAIHAAYIAVLSFVCLVNWRASTADRVAFRSLVETLDEGVLMLDRSGALAAVNPSAARILGMAPERILAVNGTDPDWSFIGPDGRPVPEADRPMRVTARTGVPQVAVPLGLRRADGSTRWLSVSTRAVDADDDGPHTVVVSFTDVTEEHDAILALERSNAELQQFAYVASHDLSEPLRMVSSYLQLLRRRYHGRLDPDADEFIDYAVDGATRMRALIEDLLTYSRAGRGGAPEPVDLGHVAADVLRSLAVAVVESGAQIEIGELPWVLGDRVQLEQLLQNLVANALKFRSGERARVWVRAEPAVAGRVQLAVADGGIGIDPLHRDRVFKMFQRLHDREAYEGTGIGLAICRKIVERHGGRIWVDEREGGGTVFRFTLPVAAPAEPHADTPAGTAAAPA
jgi:PAS domain S-box-containing protein